MTDPEVREGAVGLRRQPEQVEGDGGRAEAGNRRPNGAGEKKLFNLVKSTAPSRVFCKIFLFGHLNNYTVTCFTN